MADLSQIFVQDTNTTYNIKDATARNDISALQAAVGSPLVANNVSAMSDTTKIYVYTGSESGYANGHWYYYNGSAWTDGGTYQSQGIGAGTINGQMLSANLKAAFLDFFEHVALTDQNGQTYYNNLVLAFNSGASLQSISAVYTQSGTIYDLNSLDDLKSDLTVIAHYDDETTAFVNTYTLSGALTVGTSTITVAYGEKTTTFSVTVTGAIYDWDFTQSMTDSVGGITAVATNCTRDENGISFDGNTDHVTLGQVFGFNRTMVIDIDNASASFGNVNGIWFWTNQDISSGFGYRYNSNSNSRGYGWYSSDTAHWHMNKSASKTWITGSAQLKATIDSTGHAKIYKDGEELVLTYNDAETSYTNQSNANYITLGSPTTTYPCFYNATIKRVRIYEGVI